MGNRLTNATSPYLRQHADNPVDWHEWGPEAFDLARRRDVPVLLSVGYSTCHWCHVMAHESFEDEDTARYMNDHFVSVKVDREERPDVDRVYMDAVTAMTGRGGWPMTVFLTPDRRPIYAGTYYPKERRGGHPSFGDVMAAVIDAWRTNRSGVHEQADAVLDAMKRSDPPGAAVPTVEDLHGAVDAIHASFDGDLGGFGGAPKFPQAPTLEFLIRTAVLHADADSGTKARDMLRTTLGAMARGGIYDHLTGGFARYSVDAAWIVPHFEKMLYDNALLARLYLRSWQVLGDDRLVTTAREVLDYLDDSMADAAGAVHAAEDADSEGSEGKFAVWTWDELTRVLGDDLVAASDIYGFTPEGNFEGANIPTRFTDASVIADRHGWTPSEYRTVRARIDASLRSVRSERTPPGRDDKIVLAWNGLALRTFAEAAAVLADNRYLARAESIATFILDHAMPNGRLVRSWRDRPGTEAFAEDIASVAVGMYTLFGVTGDVRWYDTAETLVADLRDRFRSPTGAFYATADDAETLITRPVNIQDNPTPSDNALAMEALLMHAAITGDLTAYDDIDATMAAVSPVAARHPLFAGHALAVWATYLEGVDEVAIAGPGAASSALARVVWDTFRPTVVVVVAEDPAPTVPLLAGRVSDTVEAFVCHHLACDLPTQDPETLRRLLG
ncbi:MAG: thioredoxin domain-containing protein [Acidimicrobiia bacterium]|nr:thioredoxin domain-containing protein [Acidimicrobiia bacterium]